MKDSSDTTYIHLLQEEHGEAELFELLNQEEQQQAVAFKFSQHRHLYIVAHVFLRKVLSYHTGYPPQDWEFHRNSHGKPFISNPEFKSLQFNLSHTQGMIACAVNKTYAIGVDVEGSRPLPYIKQLSQQNFTENECSDIFSTNSTKKQHCRFYTYWTLKEALVKAIGCGLSMPLKQINFTQKKDDTWVVEHNVKTLNKVLGSHWMFKNKMVSKTHQLSIAIKTESIDTTVFFINSCHKDTQHWKKDTLVNPA